MPALRAEIDVQWHQYYLFDARSDVDWNRALDEQDGVLGPVSDAALNLMRSVRQAG